MLKKKLKKLQTINELSTEVYTLSHLSPNSKYLSLIINSGDSVWFKHDYNTPILLLEKYHKGGSIGPYLDEHGKWLSAFYPIKNSKNQVVGSLHADIKFNEFEELVTAEVIEAIGKAVIELLIILFILALLTRLKLSSIGKLQNTFTQLTETISAKNYELTIAKKEIDERNLRLAELNENLGQKVEEATSKLTAKNDELNLFFYHASHQMKTPIVNILGLVELAKMEEQHSDLVNYLNKISKLSKRTIWLLDQLNKVSHTNSGLNENIDLSSFLTTCAKDNPFRDCVNITSKYHNVSFKTNTYLLQVILDAVLENAIYFSRKHKAMKLKLKLAA